MPDRTIVEPIGIFNARQARRGAHPLAHPSLAQLSLRAVGVRHAARTNGHNHALVDRTFGAFPAVRRGCVRMVRVRVRVRVRVISLP